jgi:photosystem II stability/assembly factor-like uncharacterized protein
MIRRLSATLAFVLLAIPAASADQSSSLDYRSRLYDVAVHGSNVFVVGHPGLLMRSADQGQHFTAVFNAARDALFSIDINKAGVGAVVGRNGLVLITGDGGASWTRSNAFVTAEGEEKPHLFAVDVLENGVIVAVGDFGAITRSADRGKTWERVSYSLSEARQAAAQPNAAESGKKAKKGKKASADKAGKKAKGKKKRREEESAQAESQPAESDDGTASPEGLPDMGAHETAGAESEARLTGVSFGDDQHGYVVGEFGLILATQDGGLTWNRQRSNFDGLLFSVYAVNDKHALIAGSDGTVLETLDGRSWRKVPTPTQKHLFGIAAVDDFCIAVGADGVALVRPAGSAEFQSVNTHVHTWLSAVTLLDGMRGFVVGGRGRVLDTKDRGQTYGLLAGK